MGIATLAIVLFLLLVLFLRQQDAQARRVVAQKDIPRDQLVPYHYKSFTTIEDELFNATRTFCEARSWDTLKFGHRPNEFELLHTYLRGLRQDFQQGHRIFGQVISRAPEMEMFAQLEAERCRIEVSFYIWYSIACLRLRTSGVSMEELRHLTGIVATLAHRVRVFLRILEQTAGVESVDAILKNC
jgi:hypothetical protein